MRLLRRYVNNRGSALFMVLSTMTALMVSCMAMYFSVISSRSTQYAVFNQQQSKQAAMSINDALIAGMMDNTLEPLTSAMTKLEDGEKLTAGANGFAELGHIDGLENDVDLGAYTLDILKLPNEIVGGAEKLVFDVSITSVINGASSVYHTIIYYEASNKENPPAPTQVFAATGYVPNDVFLDGGRFVTDVFFDNEMTVVNAYGGKNMELWGNLSTGGSLTAHKYLIPTDKKALTFAIRNTYTANFNGSVTFAPSPCEKSTVLIGGDVYLNAHGGGTGFGNANVYVLGDLHVNGTLSETTNYFVDGNVYLEGGVWASMKHVYCNGLVDVSKNNGCGANDCPGISIWEGKLTAKTQKSWNDMANDEIMNVSNMIKKLDKLTQTNVYYKWVINDSSPNKDKYVKELDEKRGTAVKKKIHFSQNTNGAEPIPNVELKYSEAEKGCIIEDVTCDVGNTGFNNITLIIDTGDDPDNIYTIRVKANRDFDNDGVNETFSWYPFYTQSSSTIMSILVKGRGSVVVDVPKGVTYQDLSFQKFMHYGWYVLGGGVEEKIVVNGKSYKIYKQGSIDTGTADMNFSQFIHSNCTSGDGCVYEELIGTNKCPSCEGKMKVIKCGVHGKLGEFCPTCEPEKVGKHEGDCKNHVGIKEIDAYLASHPSLKTRMSDASGNIVYPSANIFLVSCDESANIRLSITEEGENIIQNSFFGYVYAPYMTFKAYGNNAGGGMVRLLGGMTVSDYIIDDSMSMIACWPDKMPTDLMSDECKNNAMQGIAGKGWKISLKAH